MVARIFRHAPHSQDTACLPPFLEVKPLSFVLAVPEDSLLSLPIIAPSRLQAVALSLQYCASGVHRSAPSAGALAHHGCAVGVAGRLAVNLPRE